MNSFIFLVDGHIYSWGMNNNYQLGHGDTKSRNNPELIKSLKSIKIINITCGSYHNFIKTSNLFFIYSFQI